MNQLKMVPVEPTREMCAAAVNLAGEDGDHHEMLGRSYLAYKAMLAVAPSPWVSVGERLPESETDVLVCGRYVFADEILTAVAGLFHGVWMSQETEDNLRFEPTHWMPLPTPPEKSE